MTDPHAIESVHISIITFDREARVVVPMTPIDEIQIPEIQTPDSGATHTGEALRLLVQEFQANVRKTTDEGKGDWAPFAFVMTDGKAADRALYNEYVPKVRALGLCSIIGCLAGPSANDEDVRGLCDHVVHLDTMDGASFGALFKWVSAAITSQNRSMGATAQIDLPPPPAEIQLGI